MANARYPESDLLNPLQPAELQALAKYQYVVPALAEVSSYGDASGDPSRLAPLLELELFR